MNFLEVVGHLQPPASGHGDRPGARYAGEDVAHALGLAARERYESYYVHVMFALQKEYIPDLVRELMVGPVAELAVDRGWTKKKGFFPGVMRAMIVTAIDERIDDRCGTCNGRGIYPKKTKAAGWIPAECPTCGGTGRKRATGRWRAECVGIPAIVWYKHWAKEYDLLMALFSHIEWTVEARGKHAMGLGYLERSE